MMAFLAARTDRLSAAFRRIDVDKSGTIDETELSSVLEQVAPDSSPEARKRIFQIVDCTNDGEIEFHEFCDRLAQKDCAVGPMKVPRRPGPPSWAQTQTVPAASTSRSRSVLKKKSNAPDSSRSSGAKSAMESRAVATHKPVTPRLQHGRGTNAQVFDDGFLRTTVKSGVEKVWYDSRDWALVQGMDPSPKGRLSASSFNAQAASPCVHSNFHDTLHLTQPVRGSPAFGEGMAVSHQEWLRGAKGHKQIHSPGMMAHPDPLMRRVQHI